AAITTSPHAVYPTERHWSPWMSRPPAASWPGGRWRCSGSAPRQTSPRFRFLHGMHRRLSAVERRAELEALRRVGEVVTVQVEDLREPHYVPADALDRLDRCVGSLDGEEEVNLLAPLDALLWDRARVLRLFGFDYSWEVYKRPHQRRWGYYALPILWRASLVGRLDPKMDRKRGVLVLNGLWLEQSDLARDSAFRAALERAVERFAAFHGARDIQWPRADDAPSAAEVDRGEPRSEERRVG